MGHRLLREKVVRQHRRAYRPLSISSALVIEGIEIRLGCQCVGLLVRALNQVLRGSAIVFVLLVSTFPGLGLWGGSNVPMGLHTRPLAHTNKPPTKRNRSQCAEKSRPQVSS